MRRRVQIDERLDTLNRSHNELETHVNETADQHALSLPQLAGLGVVFVLGFTLILAAFFFRPKSSDRSAG